MVCPVSVRPLLSLIEAEIITGISLASGICPSAYRAAFVFNASKQVSNSSRSTPPFINPLICSSNAFAISSNEYGRKTGSFMFWARDKDLLVGPTLPATQILRGASSAALRAIRAAASAICPAFSDRLYSDCEMLLALNELAVIISAPASTYSLCISPIVSGLVRLNDSLLPWRPLR